MADIIVPGFFKAARRLTRKYHKAHPHLRDIALTILSTTGAQERYIKLHALVRGIEHANIKEDSVSFTTEDADFQYTYIVKKKSKK